LVALLGKWREVSTEVMQLEEPNEVFHAQTFVVLAADGSEVLRRIKALRQAVRLIKDLTSFFFWVIICSHSSEVAS